MIETHEPGAGRAASPPGAAPGPPSASGAARLWAAAALAVAVAGPGVPSAAAVQEPEGRAYLEAERVIRLAMELPVPPERAFDAWADVNRLVEWFPHWAEVTLAEGSSYRMGWDGYDAVWEGTYLEVRRPERLVFTWQPPAEVFPAGAYPTTVRLTFQKTEAGTRMVLEHGGFRGSEEMERTLEAWRGYLYALRAYLLQPPEPPGPG